MYPYPQLTPQLQFLCKPAEYSGIEIPKLYKDSPEFWSVMPSYRYAECPFCGQSYQEKANTYAFVLWVYTGLAPNLYVSGPLRKSEQATHCSHFLGIREFINLHGNEPLELKYFNNYEGEVPFLDSHFFRDSIKTYVILHALPICRVENEVFVPAYTVFLMTYFTEYPQQVIKRTYDAQSIRFEIDSDYWPTLVTSPIAANKEDFDLAQWAERGQLGWLDFTQPNLPLHLGKEEKLPNIYRAINGQRKPYSWRRPK